MFKSAGKELRQVPSKAFSDGGYEKDIEDLIARTPSLLGDLLLTGRQVKTEYGLIDLLALDRDGTVVIIELKRGPLRRDIVAQVNDYLTCVRRLNAYELEAKANLVPQTRPEERALVARFKQHFGCKEMPQLNQRQRVVLLAERVDEDTLRALETPQFPISVMTLARFQDEAGQFLVVDTLFPAQPQEESQNGGLATDVADSFFAFFRQIEERLAQEVFSKRRGWHWYKTRKWSRAGFSRWHQNWQGLTVGSGEDDDWNKKTPGGRIRSPRYRQVDANLGIRQEGTRNCSRAPDEVPGHSLPVLGPDLAVTQGSI